MTEYRWYHELFDPACYRVARENRVTPFVAALYSTNPFVTAIVSFGLGCLI